MQIKTSAVFPPIPVTEFDWCAIDDDTYDASFEGSDEDGDHWSSGPIGYGANEVDAVQDLLENELGVCVDCAERAIALWTAGERDAVNRLAEDCLQYHRDIPAPKNEEYWGIWRDIP